MEDLCLIYGIQLLDDGFEVNFNSNNVFLRKLNYVLTGYSNDTTGLYLIEFDKPQTLPSLSKHATLTPATP